ncbi:zinc ribbon domain-containing protein [Candidatus Endomicrobiellum devescovinae]|uniref:zinc ribbon domain-containing protein n=1 Tax=Candidatus Endomicrobiellum devescovinae TaxID=3242322 RepID=UPI002819884F|nr:zinc ribbon domain-containing protein [Endomicrobium sp.]
MPKCAKQKRLDHTKSHSKSFIFKNLIHCGVCGCLIGSAQKKGKYVYLNCNHYKGNCNQKEVNENVVLPQVEKAIEAISIPDEYSRNFG